MHAAAERSSAHGVIRGSYRLRYLYVQLTRGSHALTRRDARRGPAVGGLRFRKIYRFFRNPPSGPPARSAVRPPRAVDSWFDRARQAPSNQLFAAANGQHGRAAGGTQVATETPMTRGEAERGEVLHLCARQRRRSSCAMPGRDCCTATRHFDTSADSHRADSHVSTRALDACARKQACRPQLVEWSRRAARDRCAR